MKTYYFSWLHSLFSYDYLVYESHLSNTLYTVYLFFYFQIQLGFSREIQIAGDVKINPYTENI